MATIMALTPPVQASTHSWSVNARWASDSTAATKHPASEPHSSVLKGSAAPKTSRSEASGPAPARPVTYRPPRTTATTASTGSPAFHPLHAKPSFACKKLPDVSVAGVAPGRWSPPPAAALASALAMGPKSRFMAEVRNTNAMASNG